MTGVRLLIDGVAARSLGQGVSVDRVLTRADVDPPNLDPLPPTSVVLDKSGPSSVGR